MAKVKYSNERIAKACDDELLAWADLMKAIEKWSYCDRKRRKALNEIFSDIPEGGRYFRRKS